jgi:eukaryotic-like serine/threonine-protein kinase
MMSMAKVKGPWSSVLSTLGLSAAVFQPRMGVLVTPRLRLLYALKDGCRVSEGAEAAATSRTWVADHLGLATRVEVAFGEPSAAGSAPAGGVTSTSSAGTSSAGAVVAPNAHTFQQRARVAAQLNEPHLVRILEQGNVKGVPFIVTELLEGKSFRQRLLHGPASVAEVETLVVQTCEVLARARGFGISHRSLSPDCLYSIDVADQPFVKIAGFGAGAEAVERDDYSSPERLLSGARADDRSDLWALAVSAYELLTTTLPFEAPTRAGVTVAICNGQFALPSHYRSDLPRGIDAWFARALAKEPARRFEGAREFAQSFVLALSSDAPGVDAAGVDAAGNLVPGNLVPGNLAPGNLASDNLAAGNLAPAQDSPSIENEPIEHERLEHDSGRQPTSIDAPASPSPPVTSPMASSFPLIPPPPPPPVPPTALASASEASAGFLAAGILAAGSPGASSTAVSPFPHRSVTPPPMPIGLALGDSLELALELADGEEDEKTMVKWDSPSEWPSPDELAPAAILPAVVQHPLSGAPKSVGAATPGVASARQGALTVRLARAEFLQPAAIPRTLEPAVYMGSPYLASVASALGVSSLPPASEAPRARVPFFTPDKTWLAALAFTAGVAVTWFTYDPQPSGEATAATAADREGSIRTVSVDDLPRVAVNEADDDALPAIIKPSQLPRATDEAEEPRGPPAVNVPPGPHRAAPVQKVQALTPAPPQAAPVQKVQALTPALPRAAPPRATPPRATPPRAVTVAAAPSGGAVVPPRAKVGDGRASCSPPYSIDKQGIQRLKSQCLDAATVVTGPYGAVMTSGVPSKTAAAAPSKPSVGEKQARTSASCSPPYYMDGKVRRIKVECL